ncbi:MAG TPA: hypothetical protein VHE83_06905 [Mycobacteriales bacterium]|nr:hypothetical protein [Mycobacteriales bacterium]
MTKVGRHTESFEVRGVRNGSVLTLRWAHGQLSGDPPTVDLVEVEAEVVEMSSLDPFRQRDGSVPAAPDGPEGHPLERADTALALIRRVVDRITRVTVVAPGPGAH